MKTEWIYKSGYIEGFDAGLEASKHCASCELIKECPDDNKAENNNGFKCPYTKLKYLHLFK
jgi:hypothetical protein